jgi:hypothetical protein
MVVFPMDADKRRGYRWSRRTRSTGSGHGELTEEEGWREGMGSTTTMVMTVGA